MALKWYMGNFMTGAVDKSLMLPVIDGSTSIDYDVNAEAEASIKISRAELPASLANDWKIAFESYDKMIVAVDGDDENEAVIFAGFIYKNQIDIDTGDVLDIQAKGVMEYLRNRLMIPTFTSETDATKSITLTAPSWRSLIIKLINHAFSRSGIPSGAPKPPSILDTIEPDSGDGVKLTTLYTDAFTYGDRLEDVRDNLSTRGQEFRFIPQWDNEARTRISFKVSVGSSENPHINFASTLNIELRAGASKITKFSSTSSGDNKRNRFLIQSLNDEKKTDLTAKYTGGSGSVLVDDFFNSPVELTSSELQTQLSARSSDMNTEMVEISLTLVGENKRQWINNLGKKMTITGYSNSISAGHSITVRVVEIGFDDSDVITLGVQTPAQRYPRLPKQRKKEDAKRKKKRRKKRGQKYYKGGSGSSRWGQTSLGSFGSTTGGGGGTGGVDPIDPGPLDPGASGDWGTGGGNNGEDSIVTGAAEFEYNQISVFESPLFSRWGTTIASNNTIWNCPKFMEFTTNFSADEFAYQYTENSYQMNISSAILFAGGLSDPSIAKSYTFTPQHIADAIDGGIGTFLPPKPVDLKVGSTNYIYSLYSVRAESYNPVVLEDANIYIPVYYGIQWGAKSLSSGAYKWASSIYVNGENRARMGGGCVVFYKMKINDMKDIDDPILDTRSYRGDLPYNENPNQFTFEKYGSWIVMAGTSVPTSAANYNSGGMALSTWWGWSITTGPITIAQNDTGQKIAVMMMSAGDGSGNWLHSIGTQLFPVPLNAAVPIKSEDEVLSSANSGTVITFACLGRLFAYTIWYGVPNRVYQLKNDNALTGSVSTAQIGEMNPPSRSTGGQNVWSSGRHVYVQMNDSKIIYGQITKKENGST